MDDGMLWLVLFGVFAAVVGLIVGWAELNMRLERRRTAPATASPVSNVSVNSQAAEEADGRTDGQTDLRLSALYEAAERLQVDRNKGAIIDTLLLAGWDVATIRGNLKGDNNALSAEIAEARKRLGLTGPLRELTIRQGGEVRKVPMEA